MTTTVLHRAVRSIDFERYTAFSFAFLCAATWRLWTPGSEFPNVPILAPFEVFANYRLAMLGIIVAAMIWQHRTGWAIVAAALTLLFLGDQTTLQPWAYLVAIHATLFALTRRGDWQLHRWVVASMYVFSGMGKLDFQFAHTVGQQFLSGLTFGISEDWPPSVAVKMALTMPMVECLAGTLLLFSRTRVIGSILVLAIHTSLLFVLGPWMLDHSLGVLAWNVVLIGQAYFLFIIPTTTPNAEQVDAGIAIQNSRLRPLALVVALIVMIGPCFERAGYWNHWLAWSLYAPHTSRVTAEVATVAQASDCTLWRFTKPNQDDNRWRSINLAGMSLGLRGVPIYPQADYQLRLIRRLIERCQLDSEIRIVIRGTADRWDGRRKTDFRRGKREIMASSKSRWDER